jgi:hypothetical protein
MQPANINGDWTQDTLRKWSRIHLAKGAMIVNDQAQILQHDRDKVAAHDHKWLGVPIRAEADDVINLGDTNQFYYPPQAGPATSQPRRSLWPWLVAGIALGTGGALALPLLIDAARQTAPPAQQPIINLPEQQPPVINLPPAPEPVDPGRYFLRPGQPLDR